MALQVVAMEMAEALALNDEEQVLMGTRGTLSALALGGTRVLYRLLWALGYPEFPLHGFSSMRSIRAGAGRGAHHAEDRSVAVGAAAESTGSLGTTGTCPPHSC